MSTKDVVSPSFAYITLDLLVPNTYNARCFEQMTPQRKARFDELAVSIRDKGIIEPLLVRSLGDDHYEVIAGERRYRAALLATKELNIVLEDYQVPCMIRNVTEDEAFDLMLIENMQRDDLTPFETAQAFKVFIDRHGNSPEAVNDLSLRTGIPAHAIRRQVRLLALPAEVLSAWNDGTITQSHAEALTRVGDHDHILELLVACVRLKLSTRELAERIGSISPDIERGFFDKDECQTCHFNSTVQSGLFSDAVQSGKCSNPACFEAKQGAFLIENWDRSKLALQFGTRGFRFGHRLGTGRTEPIMHADPRGRCLSCDEFVSILRLTGVVVSGYSRSCSGPVACFEELYRNSSTLSEEKEPSEQAVEKTTAESEKAAGKIVQSAEPLEMKPQAAAKPAAKKASSKTETSDETGPVFDLSRGIKHRDAFYRTILPEKSAELGAEDSRHMRLALLALVLAVPSAKLRLITSQKYPDTIKNEQFATSIFDDIPFDDLQILLGDIALSKILDATVQPELRRIVAENLAVTVENDWRITKDYLQELTKGEIVRIGEEPEVNIWKDSKAEEYRNKKHKGKALLSLKKEELIDIILKSGVELKGRVPAEVLGKRQG